MHKTEIIDPYFIFDPTVTGEDSSMVLCYYSTPKMLDFPASPIFEQDGALSRWSGSVSVYLDTKFP